MSRKGRFGKYGEIKRKSRLRASRFAKVRRFEAKGKMRRRRKVGTRAVK